jgi:hypothetical protein
MLFWAAYENSLANVVLKRNGQDGSSQKNLPSLVACHRDTNLKFAALSKGNQNPPYALGLPAI